MLAVVSFIVWSAVFGLAAGAITNGKGRGWLSGIIGGSFLGPFGIILALCVSHAKTEQRTK